MAAFAVVPGQRASWRSLQRRQLARGFLPWTSPNPEKGTKISSEGRHEGGNATEAIGPVVGCVLVPSPKFGLGEGDKHTSYALLLPVTCWMAVFTQPLPLPCRSLRKSTRHFVTSAFLSGLTPAQSRNLF